MSDWLLFSENALDTITSKWISKKKITANQRFVLRIIQKMENGNWRKDKENELGIERWEAKNRESPIFSVELTPDDFLFFEPIFTFDLIRFIKPIIKKESYGGDLEDIEKSVSLHLMVHKISNYPKNNNRISIEESEYSKCDTFFLNKLDNPKKEQFRYQKELVYVNQLQLLKVLNGKRKGLLLHITYDQALILKRVPGPFLLSGEAGSGKTTLITIWLFLNHVLLKGKRKDKQLFVTYSEMLKEKTEEDLAMMLDESYKTKTNPNGINPCPIKFMTYNDLLRDIARSGHFVETYPRKKHIGLTQFINQYGFKFVQRGLNPYLAWDEIRSVIKGRWDPEWGDKQKLIDLKEYKDLKTSKNQTKIEGAQKEKYWKATKELYQKNMEENGFWDNIDLARICYWKFFQQDMIGLYDSYERLACDEIQDLSPIEIRLLILLLTDHVERGDIDSTEFLGDRLDRIFLTGDQAQVINPSGFNWSTLRTILYNENQRPDDIQKEKTLKRNFRCTKEIVSIANLLIEKRKELGLYCPTDKQESEKNGALVQIIKDDPIKKLKELGAERKVNPAKRLIIVKNKNEKKKLIQKLKLVNENDAGVPLTVEESKGLEWDTALLWNFFSPRENSDDSAWKYLFVDAQKNYFKQTSVKVASNRYELEHEFNLLHVALTRAKNNLYLYDEHTNYNFENVTGIKDVSKKISSTEFQIKYQSAEGRNPKELMKVAEDLWLGASEEQSASLFIESGKMFREEGDHESAGYCFGRAAEAKDIEDSADLIFQLPTKAERCEMAADSYKHIGSNGNYYIFSGKYCLLSKKYDKGFDFFLKYADLCLNKNKKNDPILFEENENILIESAIESYDTIIESYRSNRGIASIKYLKKAYLKRADVNYSLENVRKAINDYNEVIDILKTLGKEEKKHLDEAIEIIDKIILKREGLRNDEVTADLHMNKSDVYGNNYKDYELASKEANRAYLIYSQISGTFDKSMNCLNKVKKYREMDDRFDLDTRKLIVGLYRNNSFSICRKEWLEIIDHHISTNQFGNAWQELLSLSTYCETQERMNLALDDLEKYSKDFRIKNASNERKRALQRGIECSELIKDYGSKSSFGRKLAEAHHEEGKHSDGEKYLLDAASDLLLIGNIDESNKLFEIGEQWTAERLYAGDIANYCLKKVALRYGAKTSIQESNEMDIKFQGTKKIDFLETWTKKAAEHYKNAKKGENSLNKTIVSHKRDGRIPDSSKLKLAWIYYCKFEFLKLDNKRKYDDDEVLSCIRQATKVPKKFKTEYHDFFYRKLRVIEEKQLKESKEAKEMAKGKAAKKRVLKKLGIKDKNSKTAKKRVLKKLEIEDEKDNTAEKIFREMIRVNLKDGKIDDDEMTNLKLAATLAYISIERVEKLIEEEENIIKKENKVLKKSKKEKVEGMKFKSLSKETECYICGEKGHLSYNCPEKNIKTHRKKLAKKTKKDKEK